MRFSYYKIAFFSTYSRWRIRRHGSSEGGRAVSPVVDEECYEKTLRSLERPNLDRSVQYWLDEDMPLRKRHAQIEAKVEGVRPLLAAVKQEYDERNDKFNKLDGKSEKKEAYNIPTKGAYLGLLALVAIVELPFNLVALRVFGEAEIYIIGLSFAIGIAFAIGLHTIAMVFAERAFQKGFINAIKSHPVGVALLLVLVPVIASFALMRKSYLEEFQATLSNYGVTSNADPGMLAVVLGIILLFVSLLAIEWGRRRHDPEVNRATNEVEKAKKYFLESEKKLSSLRQKFEKAQHDLIEISTQRQHLLESYQSEEKKFRGFLEELVAIYRNSYTKSWRRNNPSGEAPCFITGERINRLESQLPEELPMLLIEKGD